MYRQGFYEIKSNRQIAPKVFEMTLSDDTRYISAPGQFVNIKIDGLFLRRPISVCDLSDGLITIIYKVVGGGTERLSDMPSGASLDLLTGLGNGFNCEITCEKPLVIGGGVGVPPMFYLAKKLIEGGKSVTAVLGFNTASEVFYAEKFEKLGVNTIITTADGSRGIKGFVTDAFEQIQFDYFYACGPQPMLKAVYGASEVSGQLSFEERMGCGFGACMGCTCKTKYGNKRICVDGPVLVKEEIIW